MTSRTRAHRPVDLGAGHRVRDCRRLPRQGHGARGHLSSTSRSSTTSSSLITEQLRRRGRRRQGDARRDARPGRRPRSRQRLSHARPGEAGREPDAPLPAGDVGIELTRQYYLRVIAARDGSPAAKAGLRTGDYVRAIDDKPTREMSVFEGMRALRGAPGSKVTLTIIRGNAADPHVVELTRESAAGVRRHRPDRRAGRRLRAHRRHRRRTRPTR